MRCVSLTPPQVSATYRTIRSPTVTPLVLIILRRSTVVGAAPGPLADVALIASRDARAGVCSGLIVELTVSVQFRDEAAPVEAAAWVRSGSLGDDKAGGPPWRPTASWRDRS